MTVPPGDGLNVAAELAGLRGEMNTGFAGIKGKLDLIASLQQTTTEDISKLSGEIEKLDDRVSALEARRWPIGQLAAVSGAVSAVVATAAYFAGQ